MSQNGEPLADEHDDAQLIGRANVPTPMAIDPPEPDFPPSPHGDFPPSPHGDFPPSSPGEFPPSGPAFSPGEFPPAAFPRVIGRASVPAPGATPDGASRRPKKLLASRKRRRWQNWIIAGMSVVILLAGVGLIGGSYFYDKVLPPDQLTLKNSTDVFAYDSTPLAKLGSEHRSELVISKLKDPIKHALIAGEDKNFYNHHGVDLWGIARAAWNNLTGGETQGASTITQQYARQAANDLEVTYARKVREAIMARKLEDTYTKEQILEFYLNTIYFGRGAHGLGAAAEAYFDLPADQVYEKMTVAQAAVLGAVLKQPEGANGFDPAKNLPNARDRWAYVLNNMVDNGWLSQADRAALKYPEPADPANPVKGVELQPPGPNRGAAWGYTDRGTGHVIDKVEDELEERGVIKRLKDMGIPSWRDGGLQIVTSIDPIIQSQLERQLNRDVPGSTMSKQRENLMGAGVVMDPKTGRVLAYYGGTNNGSGIDYADQPHPAASSFKIYTLAAAINDGISVRSRWDPSDLKKSQGDPIDLGNATRDIPDTCGTSCTLEEMTVASYNVPFYKISSAPKLGIGHQKVVAMANAAGVQRMWGMDGKPYDISKGGPFDPYVGIGKFPITVFDHAVGTATIANSGVYNKPSFILRVERKNKKTGAPEPIALDPLPAGKQTIRREVANELIHLLKKIPTGKYALSGGRESAGKTGTWENGLMKEDGKTPAYKGMNAHVWFTGFTAQLSTTIWLGSKDENKTPIKMPGTGDLVKGQDMSSSYPKEIWTYFMNQVHKEKGFKNERLAPGHNYGRMGDENRGDGKQMGPDPGECNPIFRWLCPDRPRRP